MRYGTIVSRGWILAAALQVAGPAAVAAGEADVVGVEVARSADGAYRFDVTVRHADEGWEHYADRWEVVAPDGAVLGTRTLHHPHVDEQPFTRSLTGVEIPASVEEVTVRAHDSVHGDGGEAATVRLPVERWRRARTPRAPPGRCAPSPGAVDRSWTVGRLDGRLSR